MAKPETAADDAGDLVLAFLAAMEARDLDLARSMLADGFRMTFPGTGPMTALDELIAWAKGRYRSVRKSIEGVESIGAGEATIVYVRGTLAGEWPDGAAFDGIRFIDRFEVGSDGITRQDVWNDIAEVRAA